jgi:hypothetical protein
MIFMDYVLPIKARRVLERFPNLTFSSTGKLQLFLIQQHGRQQQQVSQGTPTENRGASKCRDACKSWMPAATERLTTAGTLLAGTPATVETPAR